MYVARQVCLLRTHLLQLRNAEQQLQLVKKEQDDKEKEHSRHTMDMSYTTGLTHKEWDRLQRLNEEKEEWGSVLEDIYETLELRTKGVWPCCIGCTWLLPGRAAATLAANRC